jgi:hypothetical protein
MMVSTLINFNKMNNEHKQKLRHITLEDTNVVIINRQQEEELIIQ